MILVTGATGNVGSQVVEQLSSTGAPVRAFVRDPEKAANVWETSVEIAEGDFQRPETLAAALEGVDRLFLLMGTAENQVELENDVIDAAVRAGVRRVVKLSIYGAEIGSPVPFRDWHGRIEARLEGAGLAYTHLRPTFFMQNAAYMLAPDGVFYVPSGAGRIGWVDVRDVAAVAVRALTEDGHEGKAYDITGPEALSFAEAAERISAATGRNIRYLDVPPEAARQGMLSSGMPEWQVDVSLALLAAVREGALDAITGTVATVGRVEPRSFADYAREFAPAFA
jgi:uncharacterized protein YbjT (DUF2867 family)